MTWAVMAVYQQPSAPRPSWPPTVVPGASKIASSSDTQLRSVTINTTGLGPATVKVTLALQAQLLGPFT